MEIEIECERYQCGGKRLNWTAARSINLLSRQKAADGQQEVLNKLPQRKKGGGGREWEKERGGNSVLSVKSNKILAHVPHTPTKRNETRRVERGAWSGGNFPDGW